VKSRETKGEFTVLQSNADAGEHPQGHLPGTIRASANVRNDDDCSDRVS
jgi:hypothetical protein